MLPVSHSLEPASQPSQPISQPSQPATQPTRQPASQAASQPVNQPASQPASDLQPILHTANDAAAQPSACRSGSSGEHLGTVVSNSRITLPLSPSIPRAEKNVILANPTFPMI